MAVTKGYKQTEVGVIPVDWEVKPLQEVGKFAKGKGLLKQDIKTSGLIPAIPYTALYTDFSELLNYDQIKWFVDDETQTYITSEPCVLIASSSNMAVNTGKASALTRTARVAIGREVIVFKTISDCSYISLLLSTAQYRRTTLALARGTTIKHLYPATLQNYKIALPPLAEQEAIAEALSDADGLIECMEQLLAKKRHVKQGAMQELLTGKKRLPGFSGKWEEIALSDLFDFSGGFSASRDQLSSHGYCYLHYGDIHACKNTFIDARSGYQNIPKLDIALKRISRRSLLDDGDVVFVDASEDDEGASRHVIIVNPDGIPFISGLHTIVAKSKTNAIELQYRRYCFQTAAVKKRFLFFAVGTKVSGISKSNIAKIMLRVPTVPEQTAIAAILSDMDAEIAALESKLGKARQLKQGMMQELLTGRIRLV